MSKPKLRGSWGGKIEAQVGVGVAKTNVRRASGSTWGRSGGTLGRFRGVQGVREGPPRNLLNMSFLSGLAETGVEEFVRHFFRNLCL